MATKRKNLLVFYTDQQRRDSLGCYGNKVARTPHIDGLAMKGVRFDSHYAANPMCMPSRASFFTGRYPQAHRVLDNGISLPESETTLAEVLADAGYRTHSVGKMHLSPWGPLDGSGSPESIEAWQSGKLDDWNGPYYGFEHVELALGHGEYAYLCGGYYGKWVKENFPGLEKRLGPDNASGPKCAELACWQSNLPLEAHHSVWTADRAAAFLEEQRGDKPFFLFVSFLDPHHPFTPPAPYSTMYEDCIFPGPYREKGENDTKPEHYRIAMSKRQHIDDGDAYRPPEMTDEVLHQIMAHTYGMVSLVDHSIGRVMKDLKDLGLLEDTLVVFTSDHGELLGDHYMLYKGPYPCRSLLHTPFIISGPDIEPGVADALMSNVDVMPTLLDLLNVEIPPCVQGKSVRGILERKIVTTRGGVLESGWSKDSPMFYHHTLCKKDFRISFFPYQNDGELYDLANDPHEHRNRFHDGRFREIRDNMLIDLFSAVGCAEPPNLSTEGPW